MGGLLRATAGFRVSDSEAESTLTSLSCSELEELLRAGQIRMLPASSLLCDEGQLASHCYVVAQGTVEVAKTIDGRHHTLSRHGAGSILALMATLDGGPCRVSIRAAEELKVVAIGRDDLLKLFGVEQGACATLTDRLAVTAIRRLRRATDELAKAIHRSLVASERPGRLAAPDLAIIHAGNHAWKAEG